MNYQTDEKTLSIAGFIVSNIGFLAILASIRAEFWLEISEFLRFLIVILLFGSISFGLFIILFKKMNKRKEIEKFKSYKIKIGIVLSFFLVLSFMISYINFGCLRSCADMITELMGLNMLITSIISGLLLNLLINNLFEN